MSITPVHRDKRFMLTVGVISAVLFLVAIGKPPSEQILTFLGLVSTAFMTQSQIGQTKRTISGGQNGVPGQ